MKIGLIEDRIGRLEQFADPAIKKISVLEIISEDAFSALLKDIESNTFKKLAGYKCLLVHRSAFDNISREAIMNFCFSNRKPLAFFSGSISTNSYRDVRSPFLYINSREFYSENLLMFLKDFEDRKEVNLLLLQFGNRWKLNLLLSLRNRLHVNTLAGNVLRIRNLEVTEMIKKELIDKYELRWLDNVDFTEVSAENLQEFRSKLNLIINDSI